MDKGRGGVALAELRYLRRAVTFKQIASSARISLRESSPGARIERHLLSEGPSAPLTLSFAFTGSHFTKPFVWMHVKLWTISRV